MGRGWCRGVEMGRMLAEELKMRRVERKIHLTYKRLIKSEEIKKMN